MLSGSTGVKAAFWSANPFAGGLERISGWDLKGTPYLKAAAKARHHVGCPVIAPANAP
jgi:hypothetical protein